MKTWRGFPDHIMSKIILNRIPSDFRFDTQWKKIKIWRVTQYLITYYTSYFLALRGWNIITIIFLVINFLFFAHFLNIWKACNIETPQDVHNDEKLVLNLIPRAKFNRDSISWPWSHPPNIAVCIKIQYVQPLLRQKTKYLPTILFL